MIENNNGIYSLHISQASDVETKLREQIAREIEAIVIEPSIENAVGMQMIAARIARGAK